MEVEVKKLERIGYIRLKRDGDDKLILSDDWEKEEKLHKKVHEKIKAG